MGEAAVTLQIKLLGGKMYVGPDSRFLHPMNVLGLH